MKGSERIAAAGPTLGIAALIALAGFLYLPFRPTPLEAIDFGEFVPLLRRAETPASGFAAMLDYYAARGRFNPVTFAATTLEWWAFGLNPLGWQIARFVLMAAIVCLAYAVLRGLARSRMASLAASALFVVARAAPQSWMKVHVGEPLGVVLLLIAALCALRYQRTLRWQLSALTIAGLVTLAVLAKETMIATVPFVVIVALTYRGAGVWNWPRLQPRTAGLVACTATMLLVLAVTPIASARLSTPPGSYAASYSLGTISWLHALSVTMNVLLPSTANLLAPANLAFLALIAVGATLRIRRPSTPRSAIIELTAALSLSAGGVIVYLPWGNFVPFYALPYLFGSAMLVAISIDELRSRVIAGGIVSAAAVAIIVVFGVKWAHWSSRRFIAARESMAALVHQLARDETIERIVVAVPERDGWNSGLITRYGEALLTFPLPPVEEISCSELDDANGEMRSSSVLVRFGDDCPSLNAGKWPPFAIVRHRFSFFDGRFQPRRDSVVIELRRRLQPERLLHPRPDRRAG